MRLQLRLSVTSALSNNCCSSLDKFGIGAKPDLIPKDT